MKTLTGSLLAFAVFSHVADRVPAGEYDTTEYDATGTKQELLIKKSRCGVHGGLVVHLGCQDEKLIAQFARDARFVVHGLAPDARTTRKIRAALATQALYGRASVEQLIDSKLPYVDQLVRLLVVEEPSGPIVTDWAESELLRVLCPGGLLYRRTPEGWSSTVKPWPPAMDQWTHARHAADGNPVSRDRLVGPPTNVRWISDQPPGQQGGRDSQVIVSSEGRLFVVTGGHEQLVVARDAFSGVPLWTRPYPYVLPGVGHRTFWRQAPLIAVGDYVYLAGEALHAATGKRAFSFEGEPKLCADGVLITSAMHALDALTGERLWRHSTAVEGMAAAGPKVYLVEGPWPDRGGPVQMVCLDLKTGKQQWRKAIQVPAADAKPSGRYDGYSPGSTPNGLLAAVVYHQGVLALEVTRTYIHLFSAADGAHLRSLRYKNWSPYASGLRALMIDGRLWLPQFEGDERFDFGVTINAFSLASGRKVKTLKLATPIRQRCRPPLASEAFMFLGGMNTVDLDTGESGSRPIVRSACHIGLVPANGLLYVPPTHCRCFSMVAGYAALESRGRMGGPLAVANQSDHLRTGPAYGKISPGRSRDASEDWPRFRQDDMRRAHSRTTLPASLKLLWSGKLPGATPSSPVADHRLALVSVGDLHRIEAVDLADGNRRWSFVAAGRIDGPPTIQRGWCVFGCRDGWVYALRLADGELAWRNLAAPERRRIMVSGQLESAWPALGPVTIANGTVCAVAGRHNMAEGGIVVSGFDLSSGKKQWQRETPHRDLANPLTGGAYEPLSEPFSLTADPRPSACTLGGWLVSSGSAVQIDRLGAFEIGDGQPRALFDDRLDEAYAGNLRPLKNRSPRPDFHQWLLLADDGQRSCGVEKDKLVQLEGDEALPLPETSPLENVIAVASAGHEWVVSTAADPRQAKTPQSTLLVLDKASRRIRAQCRFPGRPVPHGLAVSNRRVLIATTDGRLLCFGQQDRTAQ